MSKFKKKEVLSKKFEIKVEIRGTKMLFRDQKGNKTKPALVQRHIKDLFDKFITWAIHNP